ncbi:MAG: YajQ family cyclic di-GMP-binding protein [Rickettsiales bacterium]|jgi:uncharacterized protein YajQ (UPF0234 family)|nr:YajQ family cyclic di-GMP-binding protein [Rickettsiales bacterium]
MPSFDVVSKIEFQEVDNAHSNSLREIGNRYDFKTVKWLSELDKKEKKITITAESDYCLEQIRNTLKTFFVRRGLDPLALDFQPAEKAGGQTLRQTIKIKEGIDQENAKAITKHFKQSKMKLQASIQGDEVRITGKSRDDLQEAIRQIKGLNLQIPLQFINFRD